MPEEEINGFRMAYDVIGGGPSVAFIHGGFGGVESRFDVSRPWWVDELFAPHFRVITYGRRGFGRSEIPSEISNGGYDIETFADDLRGLLDHLELDTVHIIGSSAGGPIAIQYALMYPDSAVDLTLVNTSPNLLTGEGSEPLQQRLAQRRAAGAGWLPDDAPDADTVMRAATARLRDQIRALTAGDRERSFENWRRTVQAYDGLDLTPRLRELNMPAYVLHGRDDEIIPAAAGYKLSNRIPHASALIIGGEGHGLLQRRSSEAAQSILEWLQAREAAA